MIQLSKTGELSQVKLEYLIRKRTELETNILRIHEEIRLLSSPTQQPEPSTSDEALSRITSDAVRIENLPLSFQNEKKLMQ